MRALGFGGSGTDGLHRVLRLVLWIHPVTLGTALDLIATFTIVAGLGFAVIEVRRFRRQRERDSVVQLVTLFQASDFQQSIYVVLRLPDRLGTAAFRERGDLEAVDLFLARLEGIGMLVGRREISISHVNDLLHAPIVIGYRLLLTHIEETRDLFGSHLLFEWVQWLAEHLERAAPVGRAAAYEEHRDWMP